MAVTLTTSYQTIGSFVPMGAGTNNETRCKLQAKIDSQNATNTVIRVRATIDLRWSSFSTTNGQFNLTGNTSASAWSATSGASPNNYFVNGGWDLSREATSYATVYDKTKTMTRANTSNSFTLGLHFYIYTNQGEYEGQTGNVTVNFNLPASTINSFTGNNLNSSFSVNYTKSSSSYNDKLRISIPNVVALETLDNYVSDTSFTLSSTSLDYIRNYMSQQGTSQVTLGAVIETWNGGTKVGESTELTNVCTFAALAPSYNSINASQIGSTSARLTASVNDNGATITSGGWQLSTDGGTNWTTYTGDWELMSFFNLTRVTTYTYRGFATNSIGTTYSSTSTFTTLADAPSYNSISASNITQTSVTLTAIIDNGGSAITAGGFQLSVDGGSTWTSYAGSETSQTITGLTPNTTYTYRGYATNAIDTTYSSSSTFTTSADSNIFVSVNGATFARAKMKVSINGGSFVDLSSDVKTSINGNPFN